jgi:hypothetical protein
MNRDKDICAEGVGLGYAFFQRHSHVPVAGEQRGDAQLSRQEWGGPVRDVEDDVLLLEPQPTDGAVLGAAMTWIEGDALDATASRWRGINAYRRRRYVDHDAKRLQQIEGLVLGGSIDIQHDA